MMAADFTASKISSMESPTGRTVTGRVLELVPFPAFMRVGEFGRNFGPP
jgi:hypothetical protein